MSAAAALCLLTIGTAVGAEQIKFIRLNKMVTSELTGNSAGAFHYYEIEYPGGDEEVVINVDPVEDDPALLDGFGFNVYGWNDFEGEGDQIDATSALLELSYRDADSTTLLIQVYNYLPGTTMGYSLEVVGPVDLRVAKQSGDVEVIEEEDALATPTPVRQPQPESEIIDEGVEEPFSPTAAITISGDAIHGTSVGNGGGALRFYKLEFAGGDNDGGENVLTVSMYFSPHDPSYRRGIGFFLYSPTGVEVMGKSTGVAGEREAVYSDPEAGTYLIQIYNYALDVAIRYSVGIDFEG